jgi:hypothetical protein
VLGAIELAGARLAERHCLPENGAYLCEGKFVFAAEPASVRVVVRLDQAVIDNHVHMLHAQRGASVDQAVFTASSRTAELTFRRSGVIETALRARPFSAGAVLIVILTLGLLAPVPAAMLLFAGLLAPWRITPAFGECAVAIVAAYCAFEAFALKAARFRWVAWVALAVALGIYLRVLLPPAGPRIGVTTAAVLGTMAIAVARLKIVRR